MKHNNNTGFSLLNTFQNIAAHVWDSILKEANLFGFNLSVLHVDYYPTAVSN